MVSVFNDNTLEGIFIGPAWVPPKTRDDDDVVINLASTFIGAPFNVNVLAPTERVSSDMLKVLSTLNDPLVDTFIGFAFVLLIKKFFNVVTVLGMTTASAVDPLRINVDVESVMSFPLLVLITPFNVKESSPTLSVPVVNVKLPLKVILLPKLIIPFPVLLIST